ncbi:MAG: DNA polymerase [Opitutaceae bacterium]
MLLVRKSLRQAGLQARLLLQVHDELVFEVPESEVDQVKPLITEAMVHALELPVPIVVETGTGKNWLEAH